MDPDIWGLVLQKLHTKTFLTMYLISKEFTNYDPYSFGPI